MAIGPLIRRCFGPFEQQVSDMYRAMFIDLDDWTARIKEMQPNARRILEVGCGEGANTEKLFDAYPDARIDAIDITDNLGRLFKHETDRVTFRKEFVEQRAEAEPGVYDLVVLCDVIHHVPPQAQESLLNAIKTLIAEDGVLAFKDWGRSLKPIFIAGMLADRFLTGDEVKFKTPAEARSQLESIFGEGGVEPVKHVRPWRTNYAFRVQKAA
jgi:2-polyprenyl-6-hydroxyphenyl methylase/3-demethylubiquinone-9 3-methyltransferase